MNEKTFNVRNTSPKELGKIAENIKYINTKTLNEKVKKVATDYPSEKHIDKFNITREEVALAALQGLLSNSTVRGHDKNVLINLSFEYADLFMSKL